MQAGTQGSIDKAEAGGPHACFHCALEDDAVLLFLTFTTAAQCRAQTLRPILSVDRKYRSVAWRES